MFFSLWPPSDWQGLAEAVAARRAAARMRSFILKELWICEEKDFVGNTGSSSLRV